MYYHIIGSMNYSANAKFSITNQLKDKVLTNYICPFILREVICSGYMFNMGNISYLNVFLTEYPVDSVWPVKKEDDGSFNEESYAAQLESQLFTIAANVTDALFKEANIQIHTGVYKTAREEILQSIDEHYSFFICPFGNQEIDDNYEYVIKPIVKQNSYNIERADEISHTRYITDVIASAIAKSKFVVADLTEARPNCYYEAGYAHALRKPLIILAKEETVRHFDISSYKWIYWKSYKDLKKSFELEVSNIIKQLSLQNIS